MKLSKALLVVTLCVSAAFAENGAPDAVRNLYPQRFTVYHRVILTVRNRNYDFNGYLDRQGNRLTAVGFNDLGGRLFHIVFSPDGAEVITKPDHMPDAVLKESLMPEIIAIYAPDLAGQADLEYRIDSMTGRCHTIVIHRGRKSSSVIKQRDYRLFEGWNRELPQSIDVVDNRWKYQMRLRLLKIKAQGS
jgi:hypothetical protein